MDGIAHDRAYKSFFSNAAVVRSLLEDFIPEPFVAGFDFDTLEQCSGEHVSADLRERRNDCLWKLQWRGRDCYVYILVFKVFVLKLIHYS